MSEEVKRNIAGPPTARLNTDDRKPLPAPAVPPKKVIIKSADMIPDMQKEAVDIAVAVSFNDFPLFLFFVAWFTLLDSVSGFVYACCVVS